MDQSLPLSVLDGSFAVCRLDREAVVPGGILALDFFSITRTLDEISIVAPEEALLREELSTGAAVEGGWSCIKVEGPLDFSLVGVLAALSGKLARAGIPLFVLSTYETDYLLVRNGDLANSVTTLSEAGHVISE